MSVISRYGSVDIRRFYVPYGLASKNVRPTRSGISFHFDEWAYLLQLLPYIHEQHPELKDDTESSNKDKDNSLAILINFHFGSKWLWMFIFETWLTYRLFSC